MQTELDNDWSCNAFQQVTHKTIQPDNNNTTTEIKHRYEN